MIGGRIVFSARDPVRVNIVSGFCWPQYEMAVGVEALFHLTEDDFFWFEIEVDHDVAKQNEIKACLLYTSDAADE